MLSLAVGVGANVAIFSAGYAMLVHPLPYADADRLVLLRPMPSHGVFWTTVARADLADWQASGLGIFSSGLFFNFRYQWSTP